MKQGRCLKCNIRYEWKKEINDYRIIGGYLGCLKCGEHLQRTTYNTKAKVIKLDKPPIMRLRLRK